VSVSYHGFGGSNGSSMLWLVIYVGMYYVVYVDDDGSAERQCTPPALPTRTAVLTRTAVSRPKQPTTTPGLTFTSLLT